MLGKARLAALFVVAATPSALAQQAPDYDNLKKMLEQKFSPAQTRSLSAQPEAEAKEKKDFQWLQENGSKKPADSAKTAPAGNEPAVPPGGTKEAAPGKQSATWWGLVTAFVSDRVRMRSPLGENVAGAGTMTAGTSAKLKLGEVGKPAADDAQSTGAPAAEIVAAPPAPKLQIKVAQAEAPVAKKNSFVIQLKPDAKEQEVSALLQKYGLSITKIIGDLGVITVEIAEDPTSGTRGLAGEPGDDVEATSDPKKKLGKILEPQIIKELRKEPIVDAAIVNSTIGTKILPRASGATLQSSGKSYAWQWAPGEAIDGNWGLKSIRMPPVWTVLDRFRKRNPDAARPKVGIIDAGFAENPNVPFQSMQDVQKLTVLRPDCNSHHAMHVAGIIGARQGDTPGIDGIIPDARLDAVAISNQAANEAGNLGVEELWELQTLLFDEVLGKTMDYLVDNVVKQDNLRVINISLGYNFLAKKLIGSANLDDVEGLKLHIHHQASIIRRMAQRVDDKILFVVAAGNDSEDRAEPLAARWASPFAWAGTYEGTTDKPARNILVVEASDRKRERAAFSNIGGHVAAPGIDIMSTLAHGVSAFAVCSGTSQAAPHVAALAAILFELDPTKKPWEILDLIKATATPRPEGSIGAPTIDALEAALQIAGTKSLLADLDGSGTVDGADLASFKRQLDAIRASATTEAAFSEDLNGDGTVDDNECHWPVIDLNGSGEAATQPADFKRLGGLFRSDLNVVAMAWSDADKPFDVALGEAGLTATAASDTLTASNGETAKKSALCRRKDQIVDPNLVVAAALEGGTRETASDEAGGGTAAEGSKEAAPGADQSRAEGGAAKPDGVAAETNAPAARGEPAGAGTESGETRGLATAPEDGASLKATVQKAVDELKKLNPRLRITINPATGLPASISGFLPRPGAGAALGSSARGVGEEQSEEETKAAVEGFFATSGLTAAFPTQNKKARTEYLGRRRDPDFPDRFIATVEQRVGDIPVFGSSAKLTVEGLAGVTKYVGTPSQVAITDTKTEIAEADAIEAARARLAEIEAEDTGEEARRLAPEAISGEAKARLVIFDPALVDKKAKGATRIAWLVEIDSFRLFVDAKTKEVFHYYRDRPTGAMRRIFDLEHGKIFPGKKILDEETATREESMAQDGELAFRFTGDVRDFFFLVFGRNGFDDNDGDGPKGGATLESYIRYSNVRDAFWCPSKSYECPRPNVMVFGPGYAGSIDVVGHEMTHGVIAHEKNLLYLNEPGAVNESLADIFGTLIELHARVPSGNWVIGENAPSFSEASPLRSLADPNLKNAEGQSMFDRTKRFSMANRGQPDNYAEVLSTADTLCATTRYQDNGCVHFNSGILNKFAYLISEGGEHRGVTVNGIGRVKLARIAYRTMTAQLNESSGLIEAADGFALSCLELAEAGVSAISASDCEQVFAAQEAVGLIYESS